MHGACSLWHPLLALQQDHFLSPSLCICSVLPAGIVQTLLEVPRFAEQLVNADQPDSERKGSTFASAFKRVGTSS